MSLRTLNCLMEPNDDYTQLMSYDISLTKDGGSVKVGTHTEGGTYSMGGTDRAELNITYNYSWFFRRFLDSEKGIRWLYGRKARDCVERLEKAVEALGTHRFENYWASTPGNAGYALSILLDWAKENPEAIFDGD